MSLLCKDITKIFLDFSQTAECCDALVKSSVELFRHS